MSKEAKERQGELKCLCQKLCDHNFSRCQLLNNITEKSVVVFTHPGTFGDAQYTRLRDSVTNELSKFFGFKVQGLVLEEGMKVTAILNKEKP